MARIRTIKPSIWGDSRFAGLSRDARLLTVGLISTADDAGRFIASPGAIAGSVYPHDGLSAATVRKWRDEIARTGLVQLYRVDGRDYGWFPNWRKHQRINRPSPSVLPSPPGHGADPGPSEPSPDGADSVSDSVNAHGGPRESLTTGRGERREEGKPPRPPRSAVGATRCTVHKRPRRGCADCAMPPLAPVPNWCGECQADEYRWLDDAAGLRKCPRCHPSVRAS